MKTIRFSLLAIAVTFAALLSCNKSDLTPAATNSGSRSNLSTADMDHGMCGMHCTCTQAQWGTDKERANDLISKYFVMQFPNGFKLGSAGGFTAWVKDANAMKMYLPMRGQAGALTKSYSDGTLPTNALLGELIALCCNIDLEQYDPMFEEGVTTPLRDLKIVDGTFKGMTVMQFFKLANEVLGGTSTQYTAVQVKDEAKAINANYLMVGKQMFDYGHLMCP
jgi:hypothetical protein